MIPNDAGRLTFSAYCLLPDRIPKGNEPLMALTRENSGVAWRSHPKLREILLDDLIAKFKPLKPMEGPLKVAIRILVPFPSNASAIDLQRGFYYRKVGIRCDHIAGPLVDRLVALGFIKSAQQVSILRVEKVVGKIPVVAFRLSTIEYRPKPAPGQGNFVDGVRVK